MKPERRGSHRGLGQRSLPSPFLPRCPGELGQKAVPGARAQYVRLEVSLSAPPRALKAPWTLWTCSVSPKESLWMTWVMSGFCGWAVALCVDTWKLPGTWGRDGELRGSPSGRGAGPHLG